MQALKETGVVAYAAEEASLNCRTLYKHYTDDETFAEEWEDALSDAANGYKDKMAELLKVNGEQVQRLCDNELDIAHLGRVQVELQHEKTRLEGRVAELNSLLKKARG